MNAGTTIEIDPAIADKGLEVVEGEDAQITAAKERFKAMGDRFTHQLYLWKIRSHRGALLGVCDRAEPVYYVRAKCRTCSRDGDVMNKFARQPICDRKRATGQPRKKVLRTVSATA